MAEGFLCSDMLCVTPVIVCIPSTEMYTENSKVIRILKFLRDIIEYNYHKAQGWPRSSPS